MIGLALALALAATPAAQPDPASSPEALRRIYDAIKPSVVQVGPDPAFAGVVLTETGLVATAYAVVKGQTQVPVTFTNGYRANAKVVAADEKAGAALLRIDGLPPVAALRLTATPPASGQAAYGFQLARALTPSVTFARVASTSVFRDNRVDSTLLTARFGFGGRAVGGPIVSWAGELLGLILANDKQGTAFALSAPALLKLVGAHASELPALTLAVHTDPAGAEVVLDGRTVGRTPLEAPMGAGEHALVLRSPGLPDTVRRLVALGPARQEVTATLFPGAQVTVQTLPNAEVWVDGVFRAVGPGALWLPGGRHWLGVSLKGHRSFGRWLEVVEGRALVVPAELPETHATLTVDSTPHGADVLLDDNRVGTTPLKAVQIFPGTYEVTLVARGYHAAHVPLVARDGQEVDLGSVRLEAPRFTLHARVPSGTEVEIDGGARHPVKPTGEQLAPGPHKAIFYAPYQYRTLVSFGGEDGQSVEVTPTFVPAGDPDRKGAYTTLAAVAEGGGGLATLLAGGFFLAAQADRGSAPTLTSTGHQEISWGLASGAAAIGLYAAGALISSLQPTPEMGWTEDAPK